MQKRLMNSKCRFGSSHSDDVDTQSIYVSGASGVTVRLDESTDINLQIEERIARTEQQAVNQRSQASGTQVAVTATDSSQLEQVVMPSVSVLQGLITSRSRLTGASGT